MTPTEATKLLEKLLLMADFTDEYGDMCDSEPYEEAVAMASKALKVIEEITVLRLVDKVENSVSVLRTALSEVPVENV